MDKAAYHFDKLYSYAIPVQYASVLQPGMRVLVPFGGGNRKRQGMVLSRGPVESLEKLKPVHALLDQEPVLSAEMLRLVNFLKETTFCSYFDAVKAILPGGIGYRMQYDYGLNPLWDKNTEALSDDERVLAAYLENGKGMMPEEKLLGMMGLSAESGLLHKMVQKGVLVREETAKRRMKDETVRMPDLKAGNLAFPACPFPFCNQEDRQDSARTQLSCPPHFKTASGYGVGTFIFHRHQIFHFSLHKRSMRIPYGLYLLCVFYGCQQSKTSSNGISNLSKRTEKASLNLPCRSCSREQ